MKYSASELIELLYRIGMFVFSIDNQSVLTKSQREICEEKEHVKFQEVL